MPKIKKKVLISANDYGAGVNLLPVYYSALKHESIDIHCLISGPASALFKKVNHDNITFFTGDFHQLADFLVEQVDRIAPDAILTGMTGEHVGIDEILLKLYKNKIKTFSFQDYWGYVNSGLEVIADRIFVIDQLAYDQTRIKVAAELTLVGTPKYDYFIYYKASEINNHRARLRDQIDLHETIIFVGQPLWHLAGYHKTLKAIMQTAKKTVYYLPHPAEKLMPHEQKFLINIGMKLFEHLAFSVEAILLECAYILTCFSTCLFDICLLKHIYQQSSPTSAVLFLYEDISAHHAKFSGEMNFFPAQQVNTHLICEMSSLEKFFSNDYYQIESRDKTIYQPGASQTILASILQSLSF